MTPTEITPASVLFDLMKREGGVSHKELAGLLLSGRPLSDGRSPQSRIGDRTWISRFIVHAPVGTLTDQYFCDYSVGALRLASRMKSREKRALSGSQILSMVCGSAGEAMDEALRVHGQDPTLYRNMLARLSQEGSLTPDERAEVAMVLLVTVACTADVRRAVAEATAFAQDTYGGGLVTPATVMVKAETGERPAGSEEPVLGLLRVVDGLVVGTPQWLEPTETGSEIGSLALTVGAVNAVGPDVSGRHARIWREPDGTWYVEDLGSKNGTTLESALTGERVEVPFAKNGRSDDDRHPVPIAPGDQLTFASSTFVVIEGLAD